MIDKSFFIFGAGYSGKAFGRFVREAAFEHLPDVNAPPPLIPPHKGEGELPLAKSPSPLWGGVRGGGVQTFKNITGTTRSVEKFSELEKAGISPMLFDGLLTPEVEAALASTTHLIISIAPDEAGDPVLNTSRKIIVQKMPALQWIGYLSTVGVYGDHGGGWVDESAECRPVSKRSKLRVDAENAWLALGREINKPVAILRLSGIYGPGRNALVNLENGTAKRLIKPDQVFNRIHCDDIAGALWHLGGRGLGGVFNVTDDEPAPPQDVVTYAASLMGIEPPPEIPFETAQLSPMARSFYGENKRVSNAAIETTGYAFAFPDYRTAFDAMWAAGNWRDGDARSPMKRS